MSRVLKRPMFKMGGSTGAGITSGLSRQGYKGAGSVDWGEVDVLSEQIKNRYGAVPRQGYNVWDFLTEWGLNMASSPPMGNVIQTAAGTAREPHSKMVEGKGKDEMAQYMANMASTDKALAAFTDIKVAQTEAEANRELKNLPFKRQALENAHKIQATKRQGEFGYNINEALGISTGNLFIAEMMDEKGGAVNAGQVQRTYTDDGKSLVPIDVTILDPAKIWWDPKTLQWFTVKQTGEGTGEAVFHGSKEQAFAALGSTVKTGDGTGGETRGDTGDGTKKVTEKDKWRYLPEDTSKKLKKWLDETKSQEGSLGEADIDMSQAQTQAIIKKEEDKTLTDEAFKWWKDNDPTLSKSYGNQGWYGVN